MKNKKLILSIVATVAFVIIGTGCSNNQLSNNKKTLSDGKSVENVTTDGNTIGNTVGNITNGGIVTQQGDWIYYNNNDKGLYKIKTDGTSRQHLSLDIAKDINVIGDYLYFYRSSSADKSGGLAKLKNDGTKESLEVEEILEPESAYNVIVVDNWIYYGLPYSSDSNTEGLYRMKADIGISSKEKLYSKSVGSLNIVNGWIYFTYGHGLEVDNPGTYRMKTDGTNVQQLSKNDVDSIILVNDWIYYVNDILDVDDGRGIYKMRIDGSEKQLIYALEGIDTTFNIDNGQLYYCSDLYSKGLYKISLDGKNNQKISSDYAENINIVENWIYYKSPDEDYKRSLYRIKTDGSDKQLVE